MLKIMGHTVQEDGKTWLLSSAAEVGFRVTGATKLRLKLEADDTVQDPATEPLRPRFEVRLDGRKVLDIRMMSGETTVTVFEGEEKQNAEIRLIKLSECTQSLMALRGIETDGETAPLPERPLKVEFIGDSITCGYGVEGKSVDEPFTTAAENAGKAYAFLTAEALNADAVLTSFSGYGIVSGYTEDPAICNEDELVTKYYEKEGRNVFRLPSGRQVQDIPRDFSAFRPEYIVINLGTNDISWCGTDNERGQLFAGKYAEFLKTVRKLNPRARILCILGTMGTGLNQRLEQAVNQYCRETGDREIWLMLLEEQNAARDGLGSYSHPSEITQRLLAEKVTDGIRGWMKE